MTPERWRRIGDLFDGALRLAPAEREAWLLEACDGDDALRSSVDQLLSQDEGADRDGFLTPPEQAPAPAAEVTASWPPRDTPAPFDDGDGHDDGDGGFTPKPAIVLGSPAGPDAESPGVVQARLRELPVIYILILGISVFWRRTVLGDEDTLLYSLDAMLILTLSSTIVLLSNVQGIALGWLKILELGMIAALASRIAIVQYRLMLLFSLNADPMMAQLTMKNVVLLTSILILTYGLYVPKTWRRAALVVGPLALMPFAIMLVLTMQYPTAMGWIWRGWHKGTTPRIALLSFDAMILAILAVGSAFGARTISRLRRQVAEARQLGQYRLKRRIGVGGMGEVYLAEHQLLKRPCALKLIRPSRVADPRTLERFEREVRLTATLSHPNTVEIFDYGRTEDGTYYYVMEYLPGLSLADLVERHGPLPPARAVYLLRQVCGALREAHATGLLHRDIKPSNIFAARRGGMDDVAKLLDFGLVRPAGTALAPHLSEEGQILGTPSYMSPEQATGARELDARSDIYSLGAVAYYLLTGRPPFDEGGGIRVLIAHARDPVVPPSQVRAGIPDDLERVILRCLAKDPAGRFRNAEGLERALGECACAGDWDQHRASRWWRDLAQTPASHAAAR